MPFRREAFRRWTLSQLFRLWTALAVLAGYVYAWINVPEALTWWKRSTTRLIEAGCALLPYPWGDRLESSIGNIGLWVQITLAILALRVVVWLLLALLRAVFRRRTAPHPPAGRPTPQRGR